MTSSGESPSLLLQRAAEHLEALANEAWNEPWRVNRRVVSFEVQLAASPPFGFDPVADVGVEGNAQWIATMSPAVAGPIAAMLRFDAMRLKWAGRCEDVDKSYRGFELARLVLGLSVEEETTQ